ncbi:MAG: DUF1501 domain-containing protein [Nocardioidaceae bacterium]
MDCCEEYARQERAGLSRRGFLGGVAAAGGVAVTTSLFGEAVLQASHGVQTGGNVMVVLSFRGGIDGLGVVVPHADDAYYDARPNIAISKDTLICADDTFGLHPMLAPLQSYWEGGQFAAVHAVGLSVPNRSHFFATEEVEDADPTSSVRRGWVNRMVGLSASPVPYESVSLSTSIPPTMVEGSAPSVTADQLSDINMVGADDNDWGTRRRKALNTVWAGASGALKQGWKSTVNTVGVIQPVAEASYSPASYDIAWPGGDLGNALRDAARLIKADVGTQVITVDFGGWDMHADYYNLPSRLDGFASAMKAFLDDLNTDHPSGGTWLDKVTVTTISEFGRRLEENGNRGLDHGWGNMMLLFGGGVKGGSYYGSWPSLKHGNTNDDDLTVTTDYRQVLGEIVDKRLDKSISKVFPGSWGYQRDNGVNGESLLTG